MQLVQFMAGVPALLLYAFGIPAMGMSLLIGAQHVLVARHHPCKQDAIRTLCFVFADYKPEVPWWEGVVQVNKVGLAVVAVVLAPIELASQATIGAHLALAMLVLQMTKHAYRLPIINSIAGASLFVALLTLVGGQFLIGGAAETAVETQLGSRAPRKETVMALVSITVITSDAAFVLSCLYLLLREFLSNRRRGKNEVPPTPPADQLMHGSSVQPPLADTITKSSSMHYSKSYGEREQAACEAPVVGDADDDPVYFTSPQLSIHSGGVNHTPEPHAASIKRAW